MICVTRLRRVLLIVAGLTTAACGDNGAPRRPAEVTVVSGGGQAAVVTRPLAAPVVVEVKDEDGRPLAGASVAWSAADGAVSAPSSTTDRSGRAEVTWTLGTRAGGAQLAVTVAPLAPVVVGATAHPGAPARLEGAGGNGQSGIRGRPLPQPLTVEVQDAHGNAVPSIPVSFLPADGDGSVSATTAATDGFGRATAVWTLGRRLGEQSLTARVTTIAAPAAFSATALPDFVATLRLAVAGLPQGTAAALVVRGPDGYRETVSTGAVLELPVAGSYTVEAGEAISGGLVFDPVEPVQALSVAAGDAAAATVTYTLEITPLENDVAVRGIAAGEGVHRYFTIDVPAGSHSLTATTTGTTGDVDLYVRRDTARQRAGLLCASENYSSNDTCTLMRPEGGRYFVMLRAYQAYTDVTLHTRWRPGGALSLSSAGLPSGARPSFSISGPENYSAAFSADTTLGGLLPGTYSVRAEAVEAGGTIFRPAVADHSVEVSAGSSGSVSATYSAGAGRINLDIAGLYVTQGAQSDDGSIPLLQDRDALLRVFARGSMINTVSADVRVRIYSGAELVQTVVIPAPASSVPASVDGSLMLSTWNHRIPGSLVRPGLAVVAEVDHGGLVAESDEGDNMFPADGRPLAFHVRTAPPFRVRLVPVLQSDGALGDVTTANADTYTDLARALYPLAGVDVEVRAPYSFGGVIATGPMWSKLLQELVALRIADGSTEHYYGVVPAAATQGVAGMGQIGGAVSVGADWPAQRAVIAAHEWGHNFGRRHAPCGGAAGPDPSYPYTDGGTGTHGWDMRTNTVRAAGGHFDLMSYCSPRWSSDYTYRGVLEFRAAQGLAVGAPEPSLLVWGRIAADGAVTLEPGFELTAPAAMPTGGGRYRLAVEDAAGSRLFETSFDGVPVDHAGGERHFAWAIPLSLLGGRSPAALRVSGAGAEAVVRSVAGAAGADELKVTRAGGRRVRLQWDAALSPVVLVRDARTGDVLAFARGGDQTVAVDGAELELSLTDGVRSTRRRVAVPR